MSDIAVLPELVQSKIAAGEVVERPASVVKELVENALDAGARRIEIEIDQGGRQLIRVTDDGHGLDIEDLKLAPVRHATSKLRAVDELEGIQSMGFRGEALPSIGAVSRLTLTSRPAGADAGWCIRVDAGRLAEPEPAGCAPGTQVEVRELFAVVPARLKFLKSPAAETTAAADVVTRLAAAHPEIGFRLISGGRALIDAPPAGSLRERAAQLLGTELAHKMVEVQSGEPGWLAARGLLALPSESRANRNQMYLSLSGRPIVDRTLQAAVLQGYRGLLMVRRFPVCLLDVEVAPGEVDVNVHPAKLEVRFRNSRALFGLVSTAVREALMREDLAPRIGSSEPSLAASGSQSPAVEVEPGTPDLRPATQRAAAPERPVRVAEPAFNLWQGEKNPAAASVAAAALPEPAPKAEERPARPQEAPAPGPASAPALDESLGPYRLLGQLHHSYIVVETDEGLRIFDQHALHERILYEELCARPPGTGSQRLLIPETLDLSPGEQAVLETARPLLAELGFELAEYSGRTVAIAAVPQILGERAAAPLLRDVLAQAVSDRPPAARPAFREKILTLMACRAAVKAGDRLIDKELEALLESFRKGTRPHTCPHGRPTSLVFSRAELDRRFGRT